MMQDTRQLLPEDAPALVDLFRRCYADSYANPLFYAPIELREQIATGQLRSVVVEHEGQLIAHTGLTLRHNNALVCETGNTVVDPSVRGQGLLKRLGQGLQTLVQRDGFIGYVHYPTTAHDIMQKTSVAGDGRETGIMLSYVPAETEYQAIDRPSGRLAATVVFQPFAAAPARTVYVPRSYKGLLDEVYSRLTLDRTIRLDKLVETLGTQSSKLDVNFNAKRGVLQIYLQQLGIDFGAHIQALIQEHQPTSTLADVPLRQGIVATAVEALRKLDFFYCALLPEFAETDLLRMQALHNVQTGDFTPNLANPDAQALLKHMERDRK